VDGKPFEGIGKTFSYQEVAAHSEEAANGR